MKRILFIFAISVSALRLSAQTNAPSRLAIVSESDDASAAADVLTVELSSHKNLQLLERSEIEKVYREQSLSAGNKDYLKLGQMLGADGLLLMETAKEGTNQSLNIRLVAVKPGVVLVAEKFSWPVTNLTEWSPAFAKHLELFLPKLTVLVKDAIPISVVNLRSAISSADGLETERQLKLLTIQRLSREPQLFVLERQQMQLLGEEKELKLDDSAFWNGSFLLEGVVDQNGYSKETITLNARLTPPKGGAPLLLEASGSRTNLAEVINQLAAKVKAALKVNSTVKEWSAADEAEQYFEEAKWALKWGVFPEAQAAAESAWALGKHDLGCAQVRIKAYLNEVAGHGVGYNSSEHIYSAETDDNGKRIVPRLEDADVRRDIKSMQAENPFGVVYAGHRSDDGLTLRFVFADRRPDPKDIARAIHTLELYDDYCRALPAGDLKTDVSREKNDWYRLGVNILGVASQVLRNFHFVPGAVAPDAEKLAQLRALARRVAERISDSQGGMGSKVVWGCFWQDKPEDVVGLYLCLMNDPVFYSAHPDFWFRGLQSPRLVAWNAMDQQRIPVIWDGFVRELGQSTNIFLRMEADALRFADADNDREMTAAFNRLFETVFSNRDALVTNHMETLQCWGLDKLVNPPDEEANAMQIPETLRERFRSECQPKLDAMNAQFHQNQTFALQKQFLQENKPYEYVKFALAFRERNYTRAQAEELLPLVTAYQSNLVAKAAGYSGAARFRMDFEMREVTSLADDVNHILNPPGPQPATLAVKSQRPPPAKPARPPQSPRHNEVSATNILLAARYSKIPLEQIPLADIHDFKIYSSRWTGGNLLVDIRFTGARTNLEAALRNPTSHLPQKDWLAVPIRMTGGLSQIMAAIFSPGTGKWEIRTFPEGYSGMEVFRLLDWNKSGYCFDLFQDDFYFSEGAQINRFDRQAQQWKGLRLPGLDDSRLFAVDGRLYAANSEGIFEITDAGTGVKILASTRRRPVVSALDALDSLDSPVLFAGPDHQLCAYVGAKVYGWDGNDWKQPFSFALSRPPEVFEDAVLLRSIPPSNSDELAGLWVWKKGQPQPELCLRERTKPLPGVNLRQLRLPDNPSPPARWQAPPGEHLVYAAAAHHQTNLYFFEDHAEVVSVSGQWTIKEKDGCHARLICFSQDGAEPVIVPLKFDLQQGRPPLRSLGEKFEMAPWLTPETWMRFAGDTLYIGQAGTPGIWEIPAAEVEAAVTAQKNTIQEQKRRREQRRREFAALDLNGRQAMIADPNYLNLMLPDIDANHNCLLDAEELNFFEVGAGDVFGPQEQDAVDKTLGWLTDTLLEQLPLSQDGNVNPAELPVELLKLLTASVGTPAIGIGRDRLLDLMRGHLNRGLATPSKDAHISLPAGVVSHLNDFSITVWVNLLSSSIWTRIFDFGSSQSSYMLLTPQSNTGTMRFAITTSGKSGEQQINGTSILPIGGWHHVAITLGNGTGLLYLDGKPVGTNLTMTLTPSSLGNTTQNWIGRSQWPDPYLNGVVDEFRIYGRALMAGEVEALCATTPNGLGNGPANALEAHLKFDESGGATASDSTGHGWNGTLINGANWVAGHSRDAVWLDNSASGFPGMMTQQIADPKLRFKEAVEAYWRASHHKTATALIP